MIVGNTFLISLLACVSIVFAAPVEQSANTATALADPVNFVVSPLLEPVASS
jgi:hypothetical protein